MSTITYRPEIDGLRAVAVLGVVLFHLNPAILPGGFIGVDIFFVISGYLIASIVLKERASDTFSYANFWARRIRRILPALVFLLGTVMLVGWQTLFPPNLGVLARQVIGAVTFNANHVVLSLTGGYWGNTAESLPLLHTWSLAVEEQFYILFPLSIALLLRLGRPSQHRLAIAFTASSLVLCIALTAWQPAYAFYLLPARAWEMAAGVTLAIAAHNRAKHSIPGWVATASGFGLICCLGLLHGGADFPGWRAAIPVALTALFIGTASGRSSFCGFLSSPGPVLIGKASYSLYLWHWPVIVLLRDRNFSASLGIADITIAIALTAILASISYRFVESWGRKIRRPYVFAAVSTAVLAVTAVCVAQSRHAQIAILPEYAAEWRGYLYDSFKGRLEASNEKKAGVKVVQPEEFIDAPDGVARCFGAPSHKRALVIGDSHAMALGSSLERVLLGAGYSGAFMSAAGFSPYPGNKGAQISVEEGMRFIEQQRRYAESEKPQLIVLVIRQDALSREVTDAVFRHVSSLAELSGAHILVIGQPHLLPIGDVSAPAWFSWQKASRGREPLLAAHPDKAETEARAYFAETARNTPRCLWFDPAPIFCSSGFVVALEPRGLRYIDDDHLSELGGELIEPALSQLILQSGM